MSVTDYPVVVSGRISNRDKALMDKYGFTVRDAVEMYIHFRLHPSEWRKTLIKGIKMELEDLRLEVKTKEEKLKVLEKMEEDL